MPWPTLGVAVCLVAALPPAVCAKPALATRLQGANDDVAVGIAYVSSTVADDCAGSPANENGVIEPAEAVTLGVTLQATGFARTGVTGTLSTTTPGVMIQDPMATWPDLPVGVPTASDAPHFRMAIDPAIVCLSTIDFQLTVTSNEGGPFVLSFTRRVGQPIIPAGLPAPIPDNLIAGVASTVSVDSTVALTDVKVRVRLTHTWVGDLHLKLRSPAGTEVVLLDRPGYPATGFGCPDDDMDVVFDDGASEAGEEHCAGTAPWAAGALLPVQPLAGFIGQSSLGNWVLTVSDRTAGDVGTLVDWELITTPPLAGVCKACEIVTGVSPGGDRSVGLGPGRPNPFARTSEITFELPRPGRATLRVYDIAGKVVATLIDRDLPAGPHVATWDGTDASGRAVASGIYFYRLASADGQGTRRVLLVR